MVRFFRLIGPAGWLGCFGAALLTVSSASVGARADMVGPAPAAGWWWLISGSGTIAGITLAWLGVVALSVAWLLQARYAMAGHLPARTVYAQVALWVAVLLPALPVFSGDAWSYLAQGEMLGGPIDPYVDGAGLAGGAFSAFVPLDWRFTGTPYGPLQLWLLHGIAVLTREAPWAAIILLRVVTCVFVASAAVALHRLALHFTIDPGWALWLGIANPIVMVHIVAGVHNDALALGLVLPTIWLALQTCHTPPPTSPRAAALLLTSGAILGGAAAIKITAIIALPFVFWCASRHLRTAAWHGFLLTASAAVSFTALSAASGAGFGWIHALTVNDRVVTWLSAPTGVAHILALIGVGEFENLLVLTRSVAEVLIVIILVVLWWCARPPCSSQDPYGSIGPLAHRRMLTCLAAAWAVVFVLSAVSWPWYWVFVLALMPLQVLGRTRFAAIFGLVVFLMLTVGPEGTTTLYSPPFAAIAVIGGLTAAAVSFSLVRFPRVPRIGKRVFSGRWPAVKKPLPARGASLPEPDDRAARR